jgi:hypothetical protein
MLYVFLQAELGETQIDTSDAFNDIRPPRVIAALRQERKGRKQDGRRHKVVLAHAGKSIGSYPKQANKDGTKRLEKGRVGTKMESTLFWIPRRRPTLGKGDVSHAQK